MDRPWEYVLTAPVVSSPRTCLPPDPPLTVTRLTPCGGYSGEAAIPKRPHQEGTVVPPPSQSRFVIDLWAWCIQGEPRRYQPGTAWDFHRSVSSAIVNRRDHLTPRGPEGRTVTFSSETAPCGTIRCFSTTWSLARRTRPNCDPSRSILAWPLRHRPLPDDAGCVPLRGEFSAESSSKDFWTGTAPPR